MARSDGEAPQLEYDANREALGPYADRFRPLREDGVARAWLDQTRARPHGIFTTWLVEQLSRFMTVYDAHGLTGTYPMHLLSTEQWQDLVGSGHGRLLDVGAGGGYVTEQARPLFSEIVCTETSRRLAARLSARGFRVHAHDLVEVPLEDSAAFDVIACLNVLDRTARPLSLLQKLADMLTPEARLLLAVPLPVRSHVHVRGATVSSTEPLPSMEPSFEGAAVELSRDLFEANGLRVERLARAPYLSGGDAHAPFYVLDDALWVLRKA